MDLYFLLLVAAGLTTIIIHAEILDILKIRPFLHRWEFTKKLTKCSMCTGWWVGVLISILVLPISHLAFFPFAASIVSLILERLFVLIDDTIIKINK